MASGLDITIGYGPLEFRLPLGELGEAWDDLVERNAIRRCAPDDEPEKPLLRVRVACPRCHAGVACLSRLSCGDRKCRRCGKVFGPDV